MCSAALFMVRVSMTVGVVAECIVLAIGVPLGALAGYYDGADWI
jgi:ABC-type dipeptide/oligopeptide/nickel transport system permease subunit